MHTLSPGVVVVRRAFSYVETLDGPDDSYNPPNPKRWRFTPGDTIYIVDAEGDGDSYVNFVWTYRGREATTAKFWSDLRRKRLYPEQYASHHAPMIAPLQQEWWLRVRGPRGETGWTRSTGEWAGTSYYDNPAEQCAK